MNVDPDETETSPSITTSPPIEPDCDFELNLSTFLSPLVDEIDSNILDEYQKGQINDSTFLEKSINYQKEYNANT